jgi:hypothetical protein
VQLHKNFPAFYGTQRFITGLTRAAPVHLTLFLVVSFFLPFQPISYAYYSVTPFMLHVLPIVSSDHSNYAWRRARTVKLLLLLHLSWFQILASLPCCQARVRFCSSLNARYQVSHPYRTTDIITALYILSVTILDKRAMVMQSVYYWLRDGRVTCQSSILGRVTNFHFSISS